MESKCCECGIAAAIDQHHYECAKLKKIFSSGENLMVNCYYFCEKIYEDGELLSPLEHLLMKEQDINSKHLKGPV